MNTTKICTICNQEKSERAFAKSTYKGKIYTKNQCNTCKSRNYRIKHREKCLEYRRQYYKLNANKINERDHKRFRKKRSDTRFSKKQELLNALGKDACELCDIKDIRVLSFHHINPSDKEFELAKGLTRNYPLSSLIKEASKCKVLCLNCHAIQHCLLESKQDISS